MFYLVFEATPRGAATDEDIGGAFVSCFINRPTAEEAEVVAREMIEGAGWIVTEPDEVRACAPADFEGTALLEYFEQAETDGEVLVFHQYPDSEAGEG